MSGTHHSESVGWCGRLPSSTFQCTVMVSAQGVLLSWKKSANLL